MSIITPYYGRGNLPFSILDQMKEGDEWIIVDNNPDRYLGELSPPVRVIHEPEPGAYTARRTGINASKNPYLGFLDADCTPCPDWLEKGRKSLQRYDVSIGRVTPRSETGSFWGCYDAATSFPQARLEIHRRLCTGNLFLTKHVYRSIGGFDPQRRSGPDKSLVPRLKRSGGPILYDGSMVIYTPCKETYGSIAAKGRRMAISARNQKYTLKPALCKIIPDPQIWRLISSRTKNKRLTFFLVYHYFRFHYLFHYIKGGKEPSR